MEPTVTVTIGSPVAIVCNITLNTAIGPDLSVLNYTWCHDNTDITNRSEILEQKRQTNAISTILNITSVLPSNTGVYKCRAGVVDGIKLENTSILCVKGI